MRDISHLEDIMDIWQWLSLESTQKVLGLLFAAVAGGWALFKWKYPTKSDSSKPAGTPLHAEVSADRGGIALKVNGKNNQVNIGSK